MQVLCWLPQKHIIDATLILVAHLTCNTLFYLYCGRSVGNLSTPHAMQDHLTLQYSENRISRVT